MDSLERITKAAFLAVAMTDAAMVGCNRTFELKGRIQADLTTAVFQAILKDVPDSLLEGDDDDED